jgi:hypothetical protein
MSISRYFLCARGPHSEASKVPRLRPYYLLTLSAFAAMTPVNRLRALSPELFDDIIELYINSVHVAEASATRAVSRKSHAQTPRCLC